MNNEGTETLNLIDGHAHLHEIDPVKPVLERAAAAGVNRIVAVGMDLLTNRRTLDIARMFPGRVYPAIGYHPWSIQEKDIEKNVAFIESNLDDCVAAGEAGLDYKVKDQTETVRHLAELKQISFRETARITTLNAEKLYHLS